ncbi:MAG: peptidoglycan-binding protein [Patescibacteria group bacterium]|nr:peptidoglycan-binding protein [Patescibacteria group bacterium]
MNRFFIVVIGVVVYMGISSPLALAATGSCTSLTQMLVYGDNGPQVLALQNYLYAIGYMSATPNGHFGPATLAAVKQFQSAHQISAIGTVGPLTRAAIERVSCIASSQNNLPSTTPPPTTNTTPTPPTTSTSLITAPRLGEILTTGKTYTVTWTGTSNGMGYTILLEGPNGVGAGYVAVGAFPNLSFTWKIGTVLSSNTPVAPGTYRLRIIDTIRGAQSVDRVSDSFTIAAAPLTINTVFPSTVPADDNTSVVLYGSGFTPGTSIYFDGLTYSTAHVSYASPDGRVLVFTVPSSISVGRHTFQAQATYTSSATTTTSGTAFMTITPPTSN